MRPRSLDEIVGQEHVLGPGRALRRIVESGDISSVILWGPAGSGKTTLAHVIARSADAHFEAMSAVSAGVAAPDVDGRSLLPLLAGAAEGWRTDFLIEHVEDPAVLVEPPTYCAVRTSRYLEVVYATGETELYDLKTDPLEMKNLAHPSNSTPESDVERARLHRRLTDVMTTHGTTPNEIVWPEVNESATTTINQKRSDDVSTATENTETRRFSVSLCLCGWLSSVRSAISAGSALNVAIEVSPTPPAFAEAAESPRSLVRLRAERSGETSPKSLAKAGNSKSGVGRKRVPRPPRFSFYDDRSVGRLIRLRRCVGPGHSSRLTR